jgi:group I intron endonuclease
MIGIYKILSPSGKVYIGQSWDIYRRWRDYNNKSSRILGNSFIKYGKAAHTFETIHELPYDVDQQTLDRYEQLYIDSYKQAGFRVMNLRDAGSRGKHTEASKERMSIAGKGKIITVEARKKMSMARMGKKMSEESKQRLSCARKGIAPSANTLMAATLAKLGKKASPETRLKMSLAKKGKPWTEEKKISFGMKGRPWSTARRESQNRRSEY